MRERDAFSWVRVRVGEGGWGEEWEREQVRREGDSVSGEGGKGEARILRYVCHRKPWPPLKRMRSSCRRCRLQGMFCECLFSSYKMEMKSLFTV
ncbi:hypothetical protein QJS04_geneDACA020968 [Acorus gramineus]|uniref:Uncharacterized protein n=1 Tax=Acorus gramineus TaxID=55184 RepID=A0AAV9B4V7_ACOGR|nr:hypothetical protein QJS04_geneDACA020968 [Acorus gramineus]